MAGNLARLQPATLARWPRVRYSRSGQEFLHRPLAVRRPGTPGQCLAIPPRDRPFHPQMTPPTASGAFHKSLWVFRPAPRDRRPSPPPDQPSQALPRGRVSPAAWWRLAREVTRPPRAPASVEARRRVRQRVHREGPRPGPWPMPWPGPRAVPGHRRVHRASDATSRRVRPDSRARQSVRFACGLWTEQSQCCPRRSYEETAMFPAAPSRFLAAPGERHFLAG